MTDTTTAALIGAGAVCGALLSMLALLGAIWRIALPWLRTQIAEPVQVTREHVANSHSSNLREDIDALTSGLAAARLEIGAARAEIGAARDEVADVRTRHDRTDEKVSRIGGQLDTHLTSAATTDASVHARLSALEAKKP